jgi:hypothetical protein
MQYETPPSRQSQIDFGTVRVTVTGEPQNVHLFVATLGYSRGTFVAMFLRKRQSVRLQGSEGAFRHFGGTTQEVRGDNARALVSKHDLHTREVSFNDRFHAFFWHWMVTLRLVHRTAARPRGKNERGVGYVKRNAVAGHRFASTQNTCRPTSRAGCGRSPICACMARLRSRRRIAPSATSVARRSAGLSSLSSMRLEWVSVDLRRRSGVSRRDQTRDRWMLRRSWQLCSLNAASQRQRWLRFQLSTQPDLLAKRAFVEPSPRESTLCPHQTAREV